MTVKYEYKCDICSHDYMEQRGADEPQFFTTCNKGDGGNYVLVNETKIAEELEVALPPSEVVEDSTIQEPTE